MTSIWLFVDHPGKDEPSGLEKSLMMDTLFIIHQFLRTVLKQVIRSENFETDIISFVLTSEDAYLLDL